MNTSTHQASAHSSRVGIFFSVALHAVLLLAFSLSKHPLSLQKDAKPVQIIVPLQVMLIRRNIEHRTTMPAAIRERLDVAASALSLPLTVSKTSANNIEVVNPEEPVATVVSLSQANEKFNETVAPTQSATAPESNARPDYAVNPAPEYPPLLREHGIGGTVWLRVWVDSDGRPADVKLAKGSGYRLFDEAALRVVALWRFIPAQTGEQKLASWVEFPIRFTLNG